MRTVEILRIMMTPKYIGELPTNIELAGLWARRLAEVSDKLSDAELYPLMVIGSLVYQKGCAELESSVQADLVIQMARRS
ncbi:MAG: hypothetical protein V4634_00095 [Pseudomonadota bacterium]